MAEDIRPRRFAAIARPEWAAALCGMPAVSLPLMQGENGLPVRLFTIGYEQTPAKAVLDESLRLPCFIQKQLLTSHA